MFAYLIFKMQIQINMLHEIFKNNQGGKNAKIYVPMLVFSTIN